MQSDVYQPVAILGGINTSSTHFADPSLNYIDMDVQTYANETLISSDTMLENIGLAVFYEDKLVGELNGLETLCYLLVNNHFNTSVLSVPSPFKENTVVDIDIFKSKSTTNIVKLVNGSPYITSKIYLNGTVLSMDVGSDFTSHENLELLEEYASSYLEDKILKLLYKTANEYNSDIIGFGKIARKNYLNSKEWKDINWLKLYRDSFFNVEVEINIKNSNLLLKN